MTSVGTLITGTTWRTSMSNAMRMNASAEFGVAAWVTIFARHSRAHSSPAMLGAIA